MLQPLQDLRGRERLDPGGRELERERQMVEAAADRQHVLVGLEAGPGRSRTREEEPDRFLFDERGHRVLALGRQPQELAAGDEQAQAQARGKQLAELRRRLRHLLEVVEHEQHLLRADVAGELLARAERRADRRANARRLAHCLQRHPPNAVLEIIHDLGGGLHGEPRLPRAARTGQRQQASRGCARSASTSPSSFSRPTNGVGCTGRFDWLSDLSGGNSPSPSW